ncbi:unnamed protein product [Nippostrongylus brasiliensis]|uniref:E3 ubiquitin-protein ligase bre-1 (inferred by orthology to a C. elegans protein) n=1 Tax=Nippostrongylus brasiliensis TaxID=27835 RepID=A0A0N4XEN3_NIPBR|nr:unnamed protein product [Nippostrongylus brasiliensis]
MIEALRKQLTEQSLNTADLGTRSEKIGAQLRDIQEVVASKTVQLEVIEQKKRRLEEENSTLKKQLERAKRSEALGSTDAVLVEEVRELKRYLGLDVLCRRPVEVIALPHGELRYVFAFVRAVDCQRNAPSRRSHGATQSVVVGTKITESDASHLLRN